MKKQTAVEKLVDYIFGYAIIDAGVDQSLEIEKEQIESAYRAGHNDCSRGKFADSEKYYIETFGS
jgi:hypothetical protein